VRLIVGEWHAHDGRDESRTQVQDELRAVLALTHEVVFGPRQGGREGRFTARLRTA
jgi:hypothetical protein